MEPPAGARPLTPVRPLLVLVALVLTALAVGATFRFPLVTDDPFITYRYAQNLVAGNGLVYNAGERVLSTTAPLYALVLAALGLILRDIPTLGFWLSVLSYAVCAWFIYLLASDFEMRAAGLLAGLLTLVSSGLVLTLGLETGFYLMLAWGALYFYFRRRTWAAFALLALLTLTRGDGLLLAALLGALLLWRNARARASPRDILRATYRPLLIYVLVLAPWLLLAWWWFGSPFPFTLTAKIAQAQSGLWDPFAIGFLKWLRAWLAANWLLALSALAGMAVSLSGARRRAEAAVIALWPLAHLAAYSLLGVAFYAWYVAPLLPVVALFAGLGIERTGRRLSSRVRSRAASPLFIALAGALLLALELRADLSAGMQQPSPKVEVYRRAAEWLANNTPPDAGVDALEVGVIGYYDERRTVDFVGLVDPARVPYLRAQELAQGVRSAAVDYVIAIPSDVWLPQDSWFSAAYRRVQEFRAPGFYGGQPLVVYRRVDAGPAAVESRELDLSFAPGGELLAVDVFARRACAGDVLPLALHLRAPPAVDRNLKITLQLVGAANRIVAQSDTFFPLRFSNAGQPFVDHQGLPIARRAPPGSYDLILALYDAVSGERTTLTTANGGDAGDFVALGQIEICR